MSVLFLLILVSLCVASCFLLAFIWSVRNGQYDDDYSPSVRILFDTAPIKEKAPTDHKVTNRTPEV